MAIDHALLDLAVREGAAFLRLYRWEPSCLSFGRHEPASRRYGRARVAALGIDCVRRPTGGRAVWHARELTYALAAPESAGSMRDVYHWVHRLLLAALRLLGADAVLAQPVARPPGPGAGACFAAPVGGEILLDGAKLVGSAQLRSGGGLLQHGSLLLEDDQGLVHTLTGGPPAGPAETTLSRALGHAVGFRDAAEAIREIAGREAGVARPAPAGRILSAAQVHLAHYRDPEWTWRR